VRYTEKKTDKELETKKKQNVYQQIKKTQNDKACIHHIYAQGTGTRAYVCLIQRPGVRCVHI
jgi:hypothetical protein